MTARSGGTVQIDQDALASCVSCGLCLPHCPTYRVTGEESASPRGRIAAMREATATEGPPPAQFSEFMDLCVQCRGCEAACPSSVPFGALMDQARTSLARRPGYVPPLRRAGYWLLGRHRSLLALSTLAALAQRFGLVPARLGLPRLPLRRRRLRLPPRTRPAEPGAPARAWLFTGCVMDAWMRDVHQDAVSLVAAAGTGVRLPGDKAACCGALHAHAGLEGPARALARRTVSAMPGEDPVLVDSAGCAAAMSSYGDLLGTEEARLFSGRVAEVDRWLAGRLESLPPPRRRPSGPVAVQDPCHLRHVMGEHRHVRTLLAAYAELTELDDEGLCCGAGGAYSLLQPSMADRIRELKLSSVRRSGASLVASANPGCIAHLRRGGLRVSHPVQIVAWACGLGEGGAW